MAEKKTHWRKLINPLYLGAYSLEPGKDLVVTIDRVAQEMVVGADGKKEECTVAHFREAGVKPMILNTTNMRMIARIHRTPYVEDWGGRQIQLYADKVRAFGELVEALRIRPEVPKRTEPKRTGPIHCDACQAELKPVGKMNAARLAEYTQGKYGRVLCGDCATTEAAKADPLGARKPEPADEIESEENHENDEDQD